jgi:hypothetical protein
LTCSSSSVSFYNKRKRSEEETIEVTESVDLLAQELEEDDDDDDDDDDNKLFKKDFFSSVSG